tara:strand:+ start:247 stop:612 length:366 start_codon:yes stop_codon:yes gene_type:complete
MSSRYDDSIAFLNDEEFYKSYFRDRNRPPGVYSSGIKHIVHYATPELRHPTEGEISSLQNISHIWNRGDKYYKLAYEHYGSGKYWWVIAWFNRRPTESHINIGDVIYVPMPFEKIMQYLGV